MVLSATTSIVRRWSPASFNGHNVTGLGLVIEMEFDTSSRQLLQHTLDTPLDRRMVGAVASDEFLNNRS